MNTIDCRAVSQASSIQITLGDVCSLYCFCDTHGLSSGVQGHSVDFEGSTPDPCALHICAVDRLLASRHLLMDHLCKFNNIGWKGYCEGRLQQPIVSFPADNYSSDAITPTSPAFPGRMVAKPAMHLIACLHSSGAPMTFAQISMLKMCTQSCVTQSWSSFDP